MKHLKINVFVIMCFSSSVVRAQDGLIHQYLFDGDVQDAVGEAHGEVIPGADTASALFIEGRDGTPNGAITFPVSCAAPDDWYFVKIGNWSPSQLGTAGEMTVAFWGYWYGPSTNCGSEPDGYPQDIITKRDNYDMSDMAWGINQHGFTDHVLSVHHPDKGSRATASKGMPESTWTHVGISFDGAKAYFYLDGVLFDDTQTFEYADKFDANIYVGNSTNKGTSTSDPNIKDVYNGAMDDLRFYSRKLTDAEVMGIFNAPTAVAQPGISPMRRRLIAIPAGGFFRVGDLLGSATLSVMDLNGRTLLRKNVTSNENVSLSNLAPGLKITKISGANDANLP